MNLVVMMAHASIRLFYATKKRIVLTGKTKTIANIIVIPNISLNVKMVVDVFRY